MEAANIKIGEGDEAMSLTPLFYDAKGSASAGLIEVINDAGKSVFSGLLVVGGKDGKPMIKQRMSPVKASIDRR